MALVSLGSIYLSSTEARTPPALHDHFVGLFSLIAAASSLITQMLLYTWPEESNSVRITLTFITLFSVMPLLHLVPRPKGGSNFKGLGISSS